MEIKNKTAYTYDTLLEFNRQHNRILRLLLRTVIEPKKLHIK